MVNYVFKKFKPKFFCYRMFEFHPTYLPMFGFQSNQNVQDQTFRNCTKLAAHGANVMYMLNMCFDNIDDSELIDELLTKLVTSHVRRGIEPQMFDHIVQPFSDVLRTSGQFNGTELDILNKAFLYVKNRIQQLYEEVDAVDLFDDDDSNYSETEFIL